MSCHVSHATVDLRRFHKIMAMLSQNGTNYIPSENIIDCFRKRNADGMGCCKSKNKKWDANFKATPLSSNRCDAIWESIHGTEATFGMSPPFGPCARFSIIPGVIRVQIGFSGGTMPNPSMESIGDHTVAINVEFDPKKVTFEQLLDIFWNYHDIFVERESNELRSVIFFRNEEQQEIAENSKEQEQKKHNHKIVTVIEPFKTFFLADEEHQHYLLQRNTEVMNAIGKNILFSQMAYSHLACRLEGYVVGYGTPEEFDVERPDLYIPKDLADLVRMTCSQNQIHEPDAGHMNDWG